MMSANRKAVGALQFFRPLREWKHSEVVDWAGREISPGKRGFIPADTPPILARLGMDAAPVLDYLSRKEKQSYGALGLRVCCVHLHARLGNGLLKVRRRDEGFVPRLTEVLASLAGDPSGYYGFASLSKF